jgi:hypothetical protein
MEKSSLSTLLTLLTNNLLTADEFQRIFTNLSPADRMTLLTQLDQMTTNPQPRR